MNVLKNIFKGDKVIWIIFMLLCAISIMEVFSAGSSLTYKSGDHWAPIREHAFYLLIGVGVVVLTHNIGYKKFQILPLFLLPFSAILLAYISIMGMSGGDRVNSAARSMNLLGINFQPSELGKMAVIIAVAFILSTKQDENGAKSKAFKYILIITGIICLLIAPENMSTALLLFGVVFLMMIIGRIEWKKILKLAGTILLVVVLGGAALLAMPEKKDGVPIENKIPFLHRAVTWKHRITDFLDGKEVTPAEFDISENAQVGHAHIAFASSNLIGKGPGNSVQRDFLSQAFSDFIFAIIIEEFGLIGGAFVVILYIWLLIRAGRIAQRCNRTFPAFLVMGIALLLVAQAFLNMMVAVGAFPVTGQPLPLISRGGTSIVVNCVYVGMILSVSRYVDTVKDESNEMEETPVVQDTEFKNA